MPKIVRVARVGKPHGIRGEVTVELFTDTPEERFRHGNVLIAKAPKGTSSLFNELTVAKARWNKHILLVKFVEVQDRNAAETLRNLELYVAVGEAYNGQDEWYADELIGFSVHKGSYKAASIGEITDLITGEAQDLLEIRLSNGRDVLIPFVEEIVPEIDTEQGAVVITPPTGLLELNQD
jgi:16S rRNA processing protein RimM